MSEKRKPLVFPGKSKLAGEKYLDSPESFQGVSVEPPQGGWDSSYVPGYSDARHQNEILKSKRQKPFDLELELKWVRSDKRGFHNDKAEGWEVISDAKVGEDGKPHSATLTGAGYGWPDMGEVTGNRIARDDLVLACMPGDKYRELMRKKAEYREFLEGRGTGGNIEMTVEERGTIRLGPDDESFD